ncbi:kinesin motor domain protein, partial [Ichthyophthirius multifiliis]
MENINVILRIRPLNEKEIKIQEKPAFEITDPFTIQIIPENAINKNLIQSGQQLTFKYDKCFNENITNQILFQDCVESIINSSLNGVNGTVFMYGQSGSGKTYTMMGYEKKNTPPQSNKKAKMNQYDYYSQSPIQNNNRQNYQDIDDIDFDKINTQTPDDNKGILYLSLKHIFNTISNNKDKAYVVKCSYLEIYNDQIHDLLSHVQKLNELLQIGMNQNKEFYIKGVTELSISNFNEALEVLKMGENNKHYAQTTMNHNSSRSHSIFKVNVQSIMVKKEKYGINNQSTVIQSSELNFIDLAGSEKLSNHQNIEEFLLNSAQKNQNLSPQDTIKDRIKEGQYINKSLFFLTQVISQIAEGKPIIHIPYRNSPLTKILKSSLGGNSRTMIILCITCAQSQFEQTLSTIRFGLNAKKIENK